MYMYSFPGGGVRTAKFTRRITPEGRTFFIKFIDHGDLNTHK